MRLLLSTEDLTGYEVLELARVERSSEADGRPQLSPGHIPAVLACDAWPPLQAGLLQSIHHCIGQKIDIVRANGLVLLFFRRIVQGSRDITLLGPAQRASSAARNVRSVCQAAPAAHFFPRRRQSVSCRIGGMPNDHVQALVQRAQAGDAEAWRQLHDLMSAHLLRQAQRLLGPAWPTASWHDLVQMTWQRACQSFKSFRGGPDDEQTCAVLRAWLRRIMRNVHANMVRARDAPLRRPPAPVVSLAPSRADESAHVREPQAADPSPSHALRAEERTARIEEALAQLTDPLDRRVVELVYFKSLSLREAAKELGLSYDQVRYRLGEVLVRLGAYLKEPP